MELVLLCIRMVYMLSLIHIFLGNEVLYDMEHRQEINLEVNPVDSDELSIQCLRYMYRMLFMFFIESRPELGYAPMNSRVYMQGYSLESLRDIANQQKFMHWELEFADIFAERGGFDLILGNPPWVLLGWNEQDLLSDRQPIFAIKNLTASQTAIFRKNVLQIKNIKNRCV